MKNPTWQKTVSWLVVSYILIASTVWYESGSIWIALVAALWASLLKTPAYSVHEHIWGKIKFAAIVCKGCKQHCADFCHSCTKNTLVCIACNQESSSDYICDSCTKEVTVVF